MAQERHPESGGVREFAVLHLGTLIVLTVLLLVVLIVEASAQTTPVPVTRDTIYVKAPQQQDSKAEHWAKVAPGFFMPLTFAAILLTGLAQFVLVLRLKRADVMSETNLQYDRVLEKRFLPRPIPGQDYWSSFWDLQARQFDEWQDGLIRRQSFTVWMVSRLQEHQSNPTVNLVTFQQGWANYVPTPSFKAFMDTVFNSPGLLDVVALVEKSSPKFFTRLRRALEI